jgi:hypothetical protein
MDPSMLKVRRKLIPLFLTMYELFCGLRNCALQTNPHERVKGGYGVAHLVGHTPFRSVTGVSAMLCSPFSAFNADSRSLD